MQYLLCIQIKQTQSVETMNIKLLKVLFQLLILMIIIDRSMSQCGIRWRGTCNRRSVKKANDFKAKDDETSLIHYRLLLLPQNTENDNYKQSSNAKRLW